MNVKDLKITKYILDAHPLLIVYIKSLIPIIFVHNNNHFSINKYVYGAYEAVIFMNNGEISIGKNKLTMHPILGFKKINNEVMYMCSEVDSSPVSQLTPPLLIGHRGMGMDTFHKNILYRENTVAAFKNVKNKNVQWIEFDVNVTEDNVPVIYHDFERNGKLIQNMQSHEFFSLFSSDKNTWFNNVPDNVSNERGFLKNSNIYNHNIQDCNYCSLEEVFIKCSDLSFNIEIKYPNETEKMTHKINKYKDLDAYLLPIMQVINKFDKKDLFISSFNLDVCIFLQYNYSKYNILFLCDSDVKESINKVIYYGFSGLVFDSKLFKKDHVYKLHKRKKLLIVYGDDTNDREWVNDFINAGGDGVITDEISNVIELFNK